MPVTSSPSMAPPIILGLNLISFAARTMPTVSTGSVAPNTTSGLAACMARTIEVNSVVASG